MDPEEPTKPTTPTKPESPAATPTTSETPGEIDDPRWLDRPGAVNKIIWALCLACALTVLADLFYKKHGHWHFQDFMGFDAVYGFVSCVSLVIAAKGLRVLLMRDEDYYD